MNLFFLIRKNLFYIVLVALVLILFRRRVSGSLPIVYSVPASPDAGASAKSYLGNVGLPSSMRNNNPLNLRVSKNAWKGKLSSPPGGVDPRFEAFDTWVHGVRAGIKNIKTLYARGHDSVRSLISAWAPPSDGNDTESYIQRVSSRLGVLTDAKIFMNRLTLLPLVQEMADVESGQIGVVTYDDFNNAWKTV